MPLRMNTRPLARLRTSPLLPLLIVMLVSAGCTSASTDTPEDAAPPSAIHFPDRRADQQPAESTTVPEEIVEDDPPLPPPYFETKPVGGELPTAQWCADRIRSAPSIEHRPDNAEQNNTVVEISVTVDGAGEAWNALTAPRVTGDFVGTTDQILQWVSCKWGFDEDITRARAVTESSWRMTTEGDISDFAGECNVLGLVPPCPLSYGILQVKGSVHTGTYPASTESTAFGADYAMAWLRACYDGEFDWFHNPGYVAGDEWGCVGAWFSGEWYDHGSEDYVAEVQGHLQARTWESYLPHE